MPARALVPVEAFPRIHRFRGHGPLLQRGGCAARCGNAPRCCRYGPCPRERWFRSKRFLAFTAFAAMGRSYKAVDAPPAVGMGHAVVGAGHARESAGSGRSVSSHSPLSRPWAAPTTRWMRRPLWECAALLEVRAMPARALVPVEAVPCTHCFRGHGPLLREHRPPHDGWRCNGAYTRASPLVGTPCGQAAASVIAGGWRRDRWCRAHPPAERRRSAPDRAFRTRPG
jgi:hypothetical protein